MQRVAPTDSFLAFAEVGLGLALYPWQAKVCKVIERCQKLERKKIALVAPNGAGKTERIVALSALRWLDRFPCGRVIITSADSKQIDYQLMPAILAQRAKFPKWEFLQREIRTREGGFILAFSTDEPARAEGHHARPGSPVLIVIDEAKSIAPEIFTAFDRCSFNCELLISSPGLKAGRFYEAFTSNREQHLCFEIGLTDCPHVSQERIADIIATHGEDKPFTRSTLYGEFMDYDEETAFLVSYQRLMALVHTPPHPRLTNEMVAFCDFAGGRDENVIAIRRGNKLAHLVAWVERDTTAAIGRFIVEFRKAGLEANVIWGDEGGGGQAMCDMLAAAGWPINRFNFGGKAYRNEQYISRGAEVWHNFGQMVDKGECVLLNDPKLISQLTTRKATFDQRGRQGVEKKDDMRARGLHSPDRADAVVGVFGISISGWHNYTKRQATVFDWEEIEQSVGSTDQAGLERQLKEDHVWTG
jgi:phage terminase large subunit